MAKGNVRNLHIEVPDDFHRKLKVICAQTGTKLKDFALDALREKVARTKAP